MTPNSSFRMSKQTKRTLALGRFHSEQQRNDWKRAMIQAQLHAAVQPRNKGDKKNGQTH